jgi:transcriptional regulator with XRE-family HTH domain
MNLPNYKLAELSSKAMVDVRTAQAWLKGKSVRPSSRTRLEQAAKNLGIKPRTAAFGAAS